MPSRVSIEPTGSVAGRALTREVLAVKVSARRLMPIGSTRVTDLAIYYEHPQWFRPLFAALDRRGLRYAPLAVQDHAFDPADPSIPAPVVFNRLAMSSYVRQAEHAIFYSQALLAHWEQNGARVINGPRALAIDCSKARQLGVFRAVGVAAPATRIVHRAADVAGAAAEVRFPVMVKVNVGGSGAGMTRYDTAGQLRQAIDAGSLPVGIDGVLLVQEYLPARDGRVVRCETLGGRFLYAITLTGAGTTFDLCPADVCLADNRSGSVAAYTPPPDTVHAVEAIAREAHLDVGGIEYMIDDRDGIAKFYDINALSNFVANPVDTLGYDPHEPLVDFLVQAVNDASRGVR